jgi:hypothetical protein
MMYAQPFILTRRLSPEVDVVEPRIPLLRRREPFRRRRHHWQRVMQTKWYV